MKKIFLTALAVLVSAGATAQKNAFTVSDVYKVKSVFAPTVSPKGVPAYTIAGKNLKEKTSHMNVFVDGRAITSDGKSTAVEWNTDGSALYYTSYVTGTNQLYRYNTANATSEQITDFGLGVTAPVVSADGRLVAFAAQVFPRLGADVAANLEARRRKTENKLQAHMTDALYFRHWDSYIDGMYWHIIVYNTETKTYTDVTPGNFHATDLPPAGPTGFAFSPDGKELCFTSNRTKKPALNTNSDLWTVPVTGGRAVCLTGANPAWDGSPQYSPDGRYIAYRMQRISEYESDKFRLAVYDRQTKERTVLTEDFDYWVEDYEWAPDSRHIYFLSGRRGYRPLFCLDMTTREIKCLVPGRSVMAFTQDTEGGFFYTATTTDRPVELYHRGAEGAERQVTHANDSLVAVVDFRPAESHWITGAHGDSVQFFVVKPHDFDPSKKYPLIINVHGGPQMQFMDSYRPDWQVYPGAGYVVAYPNFHGSTGYGQDFCHAITGDWGGSPFEDVMKVTDCLEALPYVDGNRMGAMGWSYGGYFMNWLQGHTKRFKCLASMMGIFDLRSMWGTTEEMWFPNFELNGQPWNSDLYEKWNPAAHVGNFATPTLILTGERDYRVSYNQSLQYFTTLQHLGIPSRLIVFDNDGHWPADPASMPLYYNAHLEWFHRYLGGGQAPWNSRRMISGDQEYE